MPAKTNNKKISAITRLHKQGLRDGEIGERLGIGKSTVSAHLLGKRVMTRKPTQQTTSDGRIVCSICKTPKSPGDFRSPKSNGRILSRPSFCKACQRDKDAVKLSDPAAYLRKRMHDLASRSRRLGIRFALTFEEVLAIYKRQDGRCFYTDEQMALFGEKDLRRSLSFDRVVPESGYVTGNVVFCTYKANAVKQDLTLKELKTWLPGWYKRLIAAGFVAEKSQFPVDL